MFIGPAGEDRRLHRYDPWLLECFDPRVQLIPRCPDRSFPVDLTARILYALVDRLFVNIQSDVIHNSREEPPCSKVPLDSILL
jgi:hypothetical protein